MTDFADLKASIAEWANRQDWSDALVTSFVRMAEQKFNAELRVSWMIKDAENIITGRSVLLPDDWLEMDLVRFANAAGADGFLPLRYKSRDEFFNLRDNRAYGYYTIQGRNIIFGGTPDTVIGIDYRLSYFGAVPQMTDTVSSWIWTKYPSLYVNGALMHADMHAIGEEVTAANFKTLTEDTIAKLNNEYLRAKASGSRVTRSRVRSFG